MKLFSPRAYLVDDCLSWMKEQEDDSFDLIVTSPPYENARLYAELGFCLTGEEWVSWALERYIECCRICRGLVAWIVEGRTRKFKWSTTPALLMADLHRSKAMKSIGSALRKPPCFYRFGVAGSGGPDWWRNDYEFIICSTKGRLPWSDNTANGKPPKYGPGGDFSNRKQDGRRVNKWGSHFDLTHKKNGKTVSSVLNESKIVKKYDGVTIANPGNVIKCCVGGGHLGSKLSHENEAPFPEKLVEPFVKCFCPPGGVVLDPFAGSFTTCAVAHRLGRRSVGLEVRKSQLELGKRRLANLIIKQD